jgi:hypothetical protein
MHLERPGSHKTPRICTKSHFNRSIPPKQGKGEKKFNEIKDLDAIEEQKRTKKVLMNQGPAEVFGSGA